MARKTKGSLLLKNLTQKSDTNFTLQGILIVISNLDT